MAELRLSWAALVEQNASVLGAYIQATAEPRALFEAIGSDLAHPMEEVRTRAFWALIAMTPELTELLYERELRYPGWRSSERAEQKLVNRGIDVVSHLFRIFVDQKRFAVYDNRVDPRGLVSKIITNWRRDEERKQNRCARDVSDAEFENIVATDITEDQALGSLSLFEAEKEILSWDFIRESELPLFKSVYVDELSLCDAARHLGLPSEGSVRQRISRARRKAIAMRDAVLTMGIWGKGNKSPRWLDLARQSIEPGKWRGLSWTWPAEHEQQDFSFRVRPLTRGFPRAEAHLYVLELEQTAIGVMPAWNCLKDFPDGRFPFDPECQANGDLLVREVCKELLPPGRTPSAICLIAEGSLPWIDAPGFRSAVRDWDDEFFMFLLSTVPQALLNLEN